MIVLSDTQPVSSGTFRDSYVHPQHSDRCIKVMHAKGLALERAGRKWWLTGRRIAASPHDRELKTLQQLKSSGGLNSGYFPKFYGEVKTDLGRGLCFEWVSGDDGSEFIRLREWLAYPRRYPQLPTEVVEMQVRKFMEFCIEHDLLSTATRTENIGFVRRGGEYKLISFDVKYKEERSLIPRSRLFPAFRKQKIRRWVQKTLDLLDARSGS